MVLLGASVCLLACWNFVKDWMDVWMSAGMESMWASFGVHDTLVAFKSFAFVAGFGKGAGKELQESQGRSV